MKRDIFIALAVGAISIWGICKVMDKVGDGASRIEERTHRPRIETVTDGRAK